MIVKIINCTFGLGLVLFIASADVISGNHTSASDTFKNVARELGVAAPTTAEHSAALQSNNDGNATTEDATDDEDYSDGCLIEYPEYDGTY